ncbi:MAG: hypothetical protein ABEJ42_00240 [Halobacteriaceae archaeon]
MPRRLTILAVVALTALAGCTGAFGAGGDGSGDSTATVSLSDVEYPDHASADGVANAAAFVDAMAATLEGEGFTANASTFMEGEDGGVAVAQRFTLASDAADGQLHWVAHWNASAPAIERYLDGETHYISSSHGVEGEAQSQSTGAYATERVRGPMGLPLLFQNSDLAASHAVERDGTTLIVYDVVAWGFPDAARHDNATGQVVVSERGVVTNATVAVPAPLADGWQRYTFDLTAANPDVEAPAWVAQANATTTTVP